MRRVPDPGPCECEAQHGEGLFGLIDCDCRCHALPLTEAAVMVGVRAAYHLAGVSVPEVATIRAVGEQSKHDVRPQPKGKP